MRLVKILPLIYIILFPLNSNILLFGQSSHTVDLFSSGIISYPQMLKPHIEGTQIVDSFGNPIKLTGFNMFGPWINFLDWGTPWKTGDAESLDWMISNGFNSIRLVFQWEDLELADDVFDWARIAMIDDFLTMCDQKGIYVMLDMHQASYSSQFPLGFQDLMGRGIPPWAGPELYPSTIEGRNQFIIDFWANEGAASNTRQHFINFWKFIAERYGSNRHVIGYDIMNEPWAPWINDQIPPQYIDFFDYEVIPAIRSVDPQTIIAIPSVDFNYQYMDEQAAMLRKETSSNILWIASYYAESYESDGNYDTSKRYRTTAILQKIYSTFHEDFGSAFMISEIGGDMTLDNNLQWLYDTLDIYHQVFGDNSSWLYYAYGKIGLKEGWDPRYDFDNPPLKDMPVVATLAEFK